MNDFQRIEIALKYQEIISKKAKEKQAMYHGNQYKKVDLRSKDPKSKTESIDTNEELGKIAGVSRASVLRAKRILRDGTEDQTAIIPPDPSALHRYYPYAVKQSTTPLSCGNHCRFFFMVIA